MAVIGECLKTLRYEQTVKNIYWNVQVRTETKIDSLMKAVSDVYGMEDKTICLYLLVFA